MQMANFLIKNKYIKTKEYEPSLSSSFEKIDLSSKWVLYISNYFGKYKYYEINGDLIYSFGYVCSEESNSIKDTLRNCLINFNENNIQFLKKNLFGQFILIIKKNSYIFIINDFLGVGNIFYNSDRNLITSSFSLAEEAIGYGPDYNNYYKIMEYLALREIKYPAWLGSETMNNKINWLLPYEYIKINLKDDKIDINRIAYEIDNSKDNNIDRLSDQLIYRLSSIIERKEYLDSIIGCSLTGGRDSRLIATLAAKKYKNCRYRIAIDRNNRRALKDFKIAKKISKINRITLDTYEFTSLENEQLFRVLTEDLVPAFNKTITPLIINSNRYDLTLGGVFGSEIFEPIFSETFANYLKYLISRARKSITANYYFWDKLIESIETQFKEIKAFYHLKYNDEKDYIRIFQLLITSRYASFILSAMAQYGYDLEPYGCYPLVELSLQTDPVFWGNKKSLIGDANLQKVALYKISKEAARVMAYASYRPAMPFSLRASPRYFYGYFLNLSNWLYKKINKKANIYPVALFDDFFYSSDGWNKYYIERIKKYMFSNLENK